MTQKKSCLKFFIYFLALYIFYFNTILGQNKTGDKILSPNFLLNAATVLDKNIRSIFQDHTGSYWFGTNGSGVYRYDNKLLKQYTVKDGLADNQINNIQEDKSGKIWFGTGGFGVSSYDGKIFTTYSNNIPSTGDKEKWKISSNDLWFYSGGGAYKYDNKLFYLPLAKTVASAKLNQNSPKILGRYGVYTILKDRKGNLWFGTQAEGVCRYDGMTFTWFTEKGLAGPAVLALFEDFQGNIWFGNNGAGLFKYDGKSVVNFTEEKGLGNKEFRNTGKSGPGTLARIYSINEDNSGNIWIGTVDAGAWKYDGHRLTNYTAKDGLTSTAINTIYKDRYGELWFGSDSDGIFRFDGKRFRKFEVR